MNMDKTVSLIKIKEVFSFFDKENANSLPLS